MPAKVKPKIKRAKIKVEEVEESPKVETAESQSAEMPTIDAPVSVPKVTSFSQLDSNIQTSEAGKSEPKTDQSKEKSILIEESVEKKESEVEVEPVTETEKEPSSADVKEWLKDIRPDTTKDVEKGGGFNGKLFFSLLVVFILLGALAGGLFYYKQKVNPGQLMQPKIEEPTAVPTVTPTLEVKVDLTTYSVNILNGSGTAGQAGVVKDLLVATGFDTTKLKTANAGSYNFESTEVQVKVDVPTSVTDAIIKALGDKYTVEVLKENLKSTSTYDIVVTVGQKK